MALMNCPECGKEISDQAVSCPHCGYPLHPDETVVVVRKRQPGRGFGVAGLVLGILGVFYGVDGLLIATLLQFRDKNELANGFGIGVTAACFGVLALVFGIISRANGHKKKKSAAAIILGAIAAALGIALICFVAAKLFG